MKSFVKQDDKVSIVVIGSFEPSIFQPEWFIRHDLVSEVDLRAPNLELNVVHRQVCQFKSPWFEIEVLTDRLILSTSDLSRSEDLRDLACNVFNILTETPIRAIGLNRISAYKCMTVDAWHNVGYAIAPKKIWENTFPQANKEPGGIGMKKAEIQIQRWDAYPGSISVIVFPSNYPPNPEVTFTLNDHINFDKLIEERVELTFSTFLYEYWNEFYHQSETGISNILEEIEQSE